MKECEGVRGSVGGSERIFSLERAGSKMGVIGNVGGMSAVGTLNEKYLKIITFSLFSPVSHFFSLVDQLVNQLMH